VIAAVDEKCRALARAACRSGRHAGVVVMLIVMRWGPMRFAYGGVEPEAKCFST
jgi:hypothetical protein